jgi:hypothetical protein
MWYLRANRQRTGIMTIPVLLFGESYLFVVDSGAGHSLISTSLANYHQLPLLQAIQWSDPAGTRISSPRARVPLQLGGNGGLEILTTALVVDIPARFGIDGFLGADVLRQYDVTLEEAMLVLGQRVTLR